jgi:hypothetical protein
MKLPLFPFSSLNTCLETYSHNVMHTSKQGVLSMKKVKGKAIPVTDLGGP